MPKSQIIIDIVEDRVPIDRSLSRLIVLARDVKNIRLETWAKNELIGYDGIDDLPEYRKAYSQSFKYSGISGALKMDNVPLPLAWIDEEHMDDICNFCIVDSIKYIVELANSKNSPVRDVTLLAGDIFKNSNGKVGCTSISQMIPKTIYISIIEEVKNLMVVALCELEDKYGNLDNLGIDTSKIKNYQMEMNNSDLNKQVFNISFPSITEREKQPWYSKVGWNIIIPIITAIIGAVAATVVIRFFGL